MILTVSLFAQLFTPNGERVTVVEDAGRWNVVWKHRHALMRVALRRTATVEDAEDVVQEAMTRAIESCQADNEGIAPWLMRVTVRLCVDTHRERGREQRRWVRLPAPAEAVPFDERICDQAEAVWSAGKLSRLPGRQARALQLRAEGLSVAEVAERLGVSYRTAESLLARARSALRAALASSLGLAVFLRRWAAEVIRLHPAYPGLVAAAALTVAAVVIPAQGTAAPPPSNADQHHMSRPDVQRVRLPRVVRTVPSPSPTGLMSAGSANAASPRAMPAPGRDSPASGESAPGPRDSDTTEAAPRIAPPLPTTGVEIPPAPSLKMTGNVPAAPASWPVGRFCLPDADTLEPGAAPGVMGCLEKS
ncbi:sigma-70 family RNA polymerase sigma factor [Streptomyces sp. NPDC051636]|uniref:sigma-70 family RNA polymerase sigma factor n=1 Tax=Streptomyces sp. NPDC051636 TaxID=3365663 RepID=UPI00379CD615